MVVYLLLAAKLTRSGCKSEGDTPWVLDFFVVEYCGTTAAGSPLSKHTVYGEVHVLWSLTIICYCVWIHLHGRCAIILRLCRHRDVKIISALSAGAQSPGLHCVILHWKWGDYWVVFVLHSRVLRGYHNIFSWQYLQAKLTAKERGWNPFSKSFTQCSHKTG